jgi:glycosyltransferase involved in cell wall biosynthesis
MTPEQQDSLTIITVIKDELPGFLRTAESVASQTNQEFEWLIIDGSNPPIDSKVLESLSLKCRVKIVVSEPLGIYNAMNRGISESSSDWVWFLNGGDFLLNSFSTKKAKDLISNAGDSVLIASPVLHFTKMGMKFAVTIPKIVTRNSYQIADFHHQGVIVTKKIATIEGGFDEHLKIAADGKFLDGIASKYPVLVTDTLLAGFQLGGVSLSNYRKTLNETRLYRKEKRDRKREYSNVLKSKVRKYILASEERRFFGILVRFYIKKRSARFTAFKY